MTTTILDPAATTLQRADDSGTELRNYTDTNQFNTRVRRTYYDMHTYQTVEFVKRQVLSVVSLPGTL